VVEGHLGTTSLVFGVTLSATSAVPVSVGFATAGAGAIPGSDYISTNGTVSFPPGTTNQAISVIVLGDIQVEGNETFFVNLGSPVNALLGRSTAIGSIVNDDGLPGQLDHFFWSALAPVQYPGAFFPVNLTALDYFNNPVSNFTGTVVLTAQAGNGASLVLSPTNTGNFENGTWKGTLVIQQTGTNVNLKATGDLGNLGLSAAFNVMGGAVPPVILSPLRSGNQLQLFWSVGVLQSAGNVNGPYTNITGALSPYLIPTGGPRQFYRVQVQ